MEESTLDSSRVSHVNSEDQSNTVESPEAAEEPASQVLEVPETPVELPPEAEPPTKDEASTPPVPEPAPVPTPGPSATARSSHSGARFTPASPPTHEQPRALFLNRYCLLALQGLD